MKRVLLRLQTKTNQLAVLATTWVLVQTALFCYYGINPTLESLKYINAAKVLLQEGRLLEARYFFYLPTTLLIAACLKAGLGFGVVVLVQVLLNGLATYGFYRALRNMQSNAFSAFACTIILICCIPYQTWNFYLYTESLFYSAVLFLIAAVVNYSVRPISPVKNIIGCLLLVLLARPLGVLFLIPAVGYLIRSSTKSKRNFVFVTIGAALVFAGLANFILGHFGDYNILLSAEHNVIICGIDNDPVQPLNHLKRYPPVFQLLLYVFQNPMLFLKLALQRLIAFFFLIRPYYSNLHNIALLLLNALLYIPILLTIKFENLRRRSAIAAFVRSSCFFFSLAVALQCDDYHNRFHHALIPLFLYLGIFCWSEKILIPVKPTFTA